MSNNDVYEVVIVGGGASGASAAYRLHQVLSKESGENEISHKILLIEAKDRLGGRTLTTPLKTNDGQEMYDLGGQYVGRTQYHVMWLLKELGIEKYKQYTTGKKVFHSKDGNIRKYDSNLPKLSFLGLLDLGNAMTQMNRMIKTIPIDDPTKCKQAEEWDGMTVETFMKKSMWTKEVRDVFCALVSMAVGTSPKECSLWFFLFAIATAGGIETAMDVGEGSAQEFILTGGAQQISEKAANKIGSENIWLNEPVTRIDQSNSEYVTMTTESGKQVKTKYVIMSAPINCVENIVFKPDLPADRHFLAQRMPLGHLFKVIITYKKAFWREAGLSGEVFNINCADPGVDVCNAKPIQMMFDAGKVNDTCPALFGLFANSRKWRKVEASVRKQEVIKQLVEYFGPDANDFIDYAEKDWAEEPYNGGCPGNIWTTGAMTLYSDVLRTPFDRVHWAGTETATLWIGYITGAVQSGLRAADEILKRIEPSLPQDGFLESLDSKSLTYSKNE